MVWGFGGAQAAVGSSDGLGLCADPQVLALAASDITGEPSPDTRLGACLTFGCPWRHWHRKSSRVRGDEHLTPQLFPKRTDTHIPLNPVAARCLHLLRFRSCSLGARSCQAGFVLTRSLPQRPLVSPASTSPRWCLRRFSLHVQGGHLNSTGSSGRTSPSSGQGGHLQLTACHWPFGAELSRGFVQGLCHRRVSFWR